MKDKGKRSETWPVHDDEGNPIHPAFSDPTFDHVNDLVHHLDTGFEDLQSVCLGAASQLHRERETLRLLKEERDRLRAALEPFAAFAEAYLAAPPRGLDDTIYTLRNRAVEGGVSITLTDCQRALKALSPSSTAEPKEPSQ